MWIFQDFEKRCGSAAVQGDGLKGDLLLFPSDDVTIARIAHAKSRRTKDAELPEKPDPLAPDHVVRAFELLTRSQVIFEHNYKGYVPSLLFPDLDARRLPTPDSGGSAVAIPSKLLESVSRHSDSWNQIWKKRRETSPTLLPIAPPAWTTSCDEPPRSSAFAYEQDCIRVVIDMVEFVYDIGAQFEPYFGSLAVYDCSARRKVSESFYFSVNDGRVTATPAATTATLGHEERAVHPFVHVGIMGQTRCTVVVEQRLLFSDLVLVLLVDRVYQGEIEPSWDVYAELKSAQVEKLKHKTDVNIPLYQKHHQPFAWSFLRLLPHTASPTAVPRRLSTHVRDTPTPTSALPAVTEQSVQHAPSILEGTHIMKMFRRKGFDEGKLFEAVEDKDSTHKKNALPGRCVVRISCPREREVSVDSSLRLLKSAYLGDAAASLSTPMLISRELDSFAPPLQPFTEHVHHLYLYIESLDLSKENKRTASVHARLKYSDSSVDRAANCYELLYARDGSAPLTSEVATAAQHKVRVAGSIEEIKMRLPVSLSDTTHLLLTVVGLKYDLKMAQRGDAMQRILGDAILPICNEGVVIADGYHELAVYKELKTGYLTSPVKETLHFISDGIPILRVRTRLVSSIICGDASIAGFLQMSDSAPPELVQSCMDALDKAPVTKLIHHMYTVLDRLVRIAGAHAEQAVRVAAMFAIRNFVLRMMKTEPSALQYIHEFCIVVMTIPRDIEPTLFCVNLCCGLEECVKVLDVEHCGTLSLLGQMVTRSMLLLLAQAGTLTISVKNAVELRGLYRSVSTVTGKSEVPSHVTDEMKGMHVNRFLPSISDALRALFARFQSSPHMAVCIQHIAAFTCDLAAMHDRGFVLSLVDVIVGAPVAVVPVPIKLRYIERLVLYEHFVPLNLPVMHVITPDWRTQWTEHHYLVGQLLSLVRTGVSDAAPWLSDAVSLLYRTCCLLDNDVRYEPWPMKERVTSLFLPIIPTLVDQCVVTKALLTTRNRIIAHQLFAVCLWVLHFAPRELLLKWLSNEVPAQVLVFVQTLDTCLEQFTSPELPADTPIQNLNLHRNAQLTILSVLIDLLVARKAARGATGVNRALSNDPVITASIQILLRFFAFANEFCSDREQLQRCTPQNVHVLLGTFYLARVLSMEYGADLLRRGGGADLLCVQLASLCALPAGAVRNEAGAFLYLLMKVDHRLHGSFSLLRTMFTIALSKQLSQADGGDLLPASVDAISKLAAGDTRTAGPPFPERVQEFCEMLKQIIVSTGFVRAARNQKRDWETIMEMMYRAARSYRTAPEMRVAWLGNLADDHAKHGDAAEAAACHMMIAAVIASLLQAHDERQRRTNASTPQKPASTTTKTLTTRVDTGTPTAAAAAKPISREVFPPAPIAALWQPALADAPLYTNPEIALSAEWSLDEHEVFESEVFTEEGLAATLHRAAALFKLAEMYETSAQVHRALLALYEKQRAFAKLKECHSELVVLYGLIESAMNARSRFLGSYYLVRFFGKMFGEFDGAEFIYKEAKLARLHDIKARLTAEFDATIGKQFLKFIMKAGNVELSDLEPDIAHIQIIPVAAFFDETERVTRPTDYELQSNISRFLYEVPFTASGSPHGEVVDQQKRKVIKKVKYPFPYMVRRQRVSESTEQELSPIANAIETIDLQTSRLDEELKSARDSSTLQMLLQGSVRLQVNVGPYAMCESFLAPEAREKQDPVEVERLRGSLRTFLDTTRRGLDAHMLAMTPAERAFHDELERGSSELVTRMAPFLVD